MRKIILLSTIVSLLSCSTKTQDKQALLNELKKQHAELREQITKLEEELSKSDTTSSGKDGKLVATSQVHPVEFNHYVEIQGRIEGDQDVTVSPEMMGNVISVNVKAGDRVQKGQTMARLDDRVVRQAYDEVKSQLDLADQVYQRQQNLWQQRIGSEMQYLQAKTNRDALQKRLSGVKEQLSMSLIKSPIDGTVEQVMIKNGQSLAPGIPAIRVVNMRALKVTAEVAESYISSIESGNKVILRFPDLNKEIEEKLDYAGKAINRLNRTFNVEIRLDDKNGEFRPNMVTVLKIVDYTNPSAFVLPVAAIQKSSDAEFVYVASKEGNKTIARKKKVVSGSTYNGNSEIKEGLNDGDLVITTGYQSILDGDVISQ